MSIVCFSLILLSVVSLRNVYADTCKKQLKIGVVLSLSAGPVASGDAIRKSIELADINIDTSNCVQFIFEDDRFQPKNTVTAVNKLIHTDKVDGLIIYGTPTSLAVSSLAERAKIPMIALSVLDRVVEGKNYIMKHWCTAERLNEAIVAETKKRNYKKVAIVSTINDAMLKLRNLFIDSDTVEVVSDDEFLKKDFDFSSIATRYKYKDLDAIYILLYPPQTALFAKRLREAGITTPFFGVHNIEDPNEVAVSRGALFGAWIANAHDGLGENYRQSYIDRYKELPGLGGGSGFDVAKMFIEASRQDVSLNKYLHSIVNFKGAFGTYRATTENDFNFGAVIKTVTEEGFELN